MELLESLTKEQILQILSDCFCDHCEARLHARISSLRKRKYYETSFGDDDDYLASRVPFYKSRHGKHYETSFVDDDDDYVSSRDPFYKSRNGKHYETSYADDDDYVSFGDASYKSRNGTASVFHPRKHREEEDGARNYVQRHDLPWLMKQHNNRYVSDSSPRYLNRKRESLMPSDLDLLLNDGIGGDSSFESGLSEEQKERVRCSLVGRKMDFVHTERIDGRAINVLQGLELHTQVFNAEEQRNIVKYVYKLQQMGRNGQLKERTYSEPRKWMRGKGRVTIQFGCCYNYAVDKYGNPPGIIRDEEVDPIPNLFKKLIKRMVKWHILPPTCTPNSCIVNIYDEGDCIPPHIDHHDFVRPFSTVSLLSECDVVLGSNLKVIGPGQFQGPVPITLPVGSVFVLNGNGADVAKHCLPSVPTKRISITFRKMDDSKLPFMFSPDPELQGITPLTYSSPNKAKIQHDNIANSEKRNRRVTVSEFDTVEKRTKRTLWKSCSAGC